MRSQGHQTHHIFLIFTWNKSAQCVNIQMQGNFISPGSWELIPVLGSVPSSLSFSISEMELVNPALPP